MANNLGDLAMLAPNPQYFHIPQTCTMDQPTTRSSYIWNKTNEYFYYTRQLDEWRV